MPHASTNCLWDGDAVVRWGAAVALVRLLPQAPPEPAVRELLGWLTSEAAPERDPEILFCDPQDYALPVVRSVPVLRERAVGAILDRLPALSGTAALSPVWDLVQLAFEADHPQLEVAFAELPALQQRVLRALVDMPELWRAEGDRVPRVFPLFSYWRSLQVPCTLEEAREQRRVYVVDPGPDAAAQANQRKPGSGRSS
jgi:hypothetical protein